MNEAFHEGERTLQQIVGVREKLAALGPRLIRDFMPEQHQQFFAQLPFVLVSAVDAEGQPWASVLANPPGFIDSPDPRLLVVRARPATIDPINMGLVTGAPVGLLGIEPHTRRRNRANGIVESVFDDGFIVHVRQSFGNCPKYIHARKAKYVTTESASTKTIEQFRQLDAEAKQLILRADTFFIATAYPPGGGYSEAEQGIDVSHRGGPPGFVRVNSDNTLSVPDFIGNSFFNTLGNIALNPRAGLLFIDFESGDLLYLAVDASIIWDESAEIETRESTKRLLRFYVREMRRAKASLPLRWEQARG